MVDHVLSLSDVGKADQLLHLLGEPDWIQSVLAQYKVLLDDCRQVKFYLSAMRQLLLRAQLSPQLHKANKLGDGVLLK